MVAETKLEKVLLDLSTETPEEKVELNRSKVGSIPLMIIYPADPTKPGIMMDGTVSPADAIKALKYAIKNS